MRSPPPSTTGRRKPRRSIGDLEELEHRLTALEEKMIALPARAKPTKISCAPAANWISSFVPIAAK